VHAVFWRADCCGPVSLSLSLSLFLAQTEETEVDAYEATLLAAAIGTPLLAAAVGASLLQ
jgi:hypothetical protein